VEDRLAVLDIKIPQSTNNQKKGLDIDLSNVLTGNTLKTSDLFPKDPDIQPTRSPQEEASVSQMATALGTEIAIGEAGRIAGATVAGPIGYVVGGLASGAVGSYIAQRMINPDDISYGRILADSFINLIPGSKSKKGFEAVTDAVARQGSIGAGIAAGGVTVEKGFDEGRMPTIDELTSAGFTGAALGSGLGLTGAAFSKVYSKIEGLEARDVLKLIKTDKDVKSLSDKINGLSKKQYERFKTENKELYLRVREDFDDENIRQRLIQDEVAGGLYKDGGILKTLGKDNTDYYLQKRLAEQKIKDQTDFLIDSNKLINDGLIKKTVLLNKTPGMEARTVDELSKDLDTILLAKYAPEVNRRLGKNNRAGMSDESAKETLDKMKKNGTLDLLDTEIKELQFLSKKILDTAEGGGLVSKTQADIWRKERPDYVPLNRISDETDIKSYFNTGRNAFGEVRTTGIKQLKGSNLEVDSIRKNINESLAQTIRRAETNKANIAFKRLLDQNKDVADSIVNVRVDKQPYYKQVETNKFQDNVKTSDTTLSVFEDGQKTLIDFKDKTLAEAFKGRPKQEMNEYVKAIFNGATWINRKLGSLYTRYSPEFMIPNLSRDRTEAFVNSMTKLGFKSPVSRQAAQLLNPKNIGTDMKTVYKIEMKKAKAETPAEKKLFEEYKDFKQSGGAVGGYGLSTVQQVEDKVARLANMTKDGTFFTASMKQRIDKVDDLVNNFNKMFEDGTRFGVFRIMKNQGFSSDKAALAARNSSFDPTLGGKQVGLLRAGYLFANPAIQANKVLFTNVFKSKENIAKTLGGLMAITGAVDYYNTYQDPEWREKLKSTNGSNWVTNRNLVFITGENEDGELNYVSLPIGYALVPLKVSMDKVQQAIRQDLNQEPGAVAKEIRDEFFDTLSPFGGSLVPTPARPYTELIANEDGLGRAIRPEWLETRNIHSSEKIFPWTAQTYGGEMAMNLADTAKNLGYEVSPESLKYLAGTYFGGPGQFLQRILNVTSKMYNGQAPSPRDIPILRRFYGESYDEVFAARAGKFSEIEQIQKEDNTEKARNGRLAYDIFKRMEDAKPNERRKILADEVLKNPENMNEQVIKGITKRIKNKQMGLTSADARVKSLSINKRAEYLANQMQTMTIPQIQKYIKDQQNKGILTDNVKEVLVRLRQFQDIKLRKTE
tara:strand:- start:390 stop:3911 length:3522 start_codon:yes stop_codon:yes gene_type:complete